MERKMRRSDRQLNESEAYEILQKGEFGILSMCTDDNEGYGIPMNYAASNDCIYFHCAGKGSKLDFIRKNPKVTFCVVGMTKLLPEEYSTLYESAIVYGEIGEINGEEKFEALMKLVEKYSPDYIKQGKEYIRKSLNTVTVLKLHIKTITGKARRK